jgi:hypothetical protein
MAFVIAFLPQDASEPLKALLAYMYQAYIIITAHISNHN